MLCMVRALPGGEEAEREGLGRDWELQVEEEELRGGGGPGLRLVLGRQPACNTGPSVHTFVRETLASIYQNNS